MVAGGYNSQGSLSLVEIFSLANRKWRRGPSLPYALHYGVGATLSFGGKIQTAVFGGKASDDDVEEGQDPISKRILVYEATKQKWDTRGETFYRGRAYFAGFFIPHSHFLC